MEYSVWSRLPDGVPDDSMTAVRAALEAQCVEYDTMVVTPHSDDGMVWITGSSFDLWFYKWNY